MDRGRGKFYEILLVASCYRKQDKLQPVGPLRAYADLTYLFPQLRYIPGECSDLHWEAVEG